MQYKSSHTSVFACFCLESVVHIIDCKCMYIALDVYVSSGSGVAAVSGVAVSVIVAGLVVCVLAAVVVKLRGSSKQPRD